jgi:hypothetical protein
MITLINTKSVIPSDGKERLVVNTETGELYYITSDGRELALSSDINQRTSWDVYPHDTTLAAGTTLSDDLPALRVPSAANMTEKFYLRSYSDKPAVIIHWGDGSVTEVKNLTAAPNNDYSDKWFLCEHTYKSTGKHTVSIYGTDYHAICHNATTKNLMYRVFTDDLPVSAHLRNFSSFCRSADLLVSVDIPGTHNFAKYATNVSMLFGDTPNLKTVTGFANCGQIDVCSEVFYKSLRLLDTDFRIPAKLRSSKGCIRAFYDCYNLALSGNRTIKDLLPDTGFELRRVDVTGVFQNCNKLAPDSEFSKVLWDDMFVSWVGTSNTFTGNSATALRAAVPKSWGGTSEVEPVTLESRLAALEAKVNG